MKFEEIKKDKWIQPIVSSQSLLLKVFKNRDFLVQIYLEKTDYIRISVNRCKLLGYKEERYPIWKDGITWDQLQAIKNATGYENHWLVECYPPQDKVVNVANIRHLYLLKETPVFGWHLKKDEDTK